MIFEEYQAFVLGHIEMKSVLSGTKFSNVTIIHKTQPWSFTSNAAPRIPPEK